MKPITLFTCSIFAAVQLSGQSLPGYRTSNYSGVNGVFFNPANIADSRFKFDLNLLTINASFGNDLASFNLKNFSSSLDSDYILNQLDGANSSPTNGMLNADIHGPSFMFNTGKKSAIAFTTRFRTVGNLRNMDVKLLKAFGDQLSGNENLPYNFTSNENMKLAFNAWTETGISYAREIKNSKQHFLKGGITLKFLGGVAGGFADLDHIRGTLIQDNPEGEISLTNTSGQIGIGLARPKTDNLHDPAQRKFISSGVGADLGFVYEFRPDHEKYSKENPGKDKNKYKIQVSLAMLDLGRLKGKAGDFQSGNYSMNVNGNEEFNVDEIDNLDLDNLNEFFLNRPDFFTPSNTNSKQYAYSLPTSLQIGVDYHLKGGIYMNLTGQLPIVKESRMKSFNNKLYTSITLTPRFEGKTLGIYIPLQYSGLTGLNAGASLRAGPGFIGSGSALTALFGKSKQVDVFIGMRFGFLR